MTNDKTYMRTLKRKVIKLLLDYYASLEIHIHQLLQGTIDPKLRQQSQGKATKDRETKNAPNNQKHSKAF